MKHILILLLLLITAGGLQAQTIIDLKPGGGVRAKTIDDYKDEMKMAEKLREDSLTYVDNLRRAFNALHTDSLNEAESLLNEALKLRPHAPGNHVVRYNLAQIARARGQWKQALEQYNELLKHYPDYTDVRLARAELNLQLGKDAEAVTDANALLAPERQALLTANMHESARFIRAAARYRLHLYAEARTDLHQLLKDNPANESARVLEALILEKTGRPNEALERLNLIVAAHPKSIEALTARAGIHTALGMHGPARADYDALIALCPDDANLYIERARVLISLEAFGQARRDLQRAMDLGVPRGVVQSLLNLTYKHQ